MKAKCQYKTQSRFNFLKTLIQISDCHVGKTTNNLNLQKIIIHIQNIQYDAIILTGDLVENGLLSEYLVLQKLLQPLNNIFALAGNHDNIINMQKVFKHKQLCDFKLENYTIQLLNSKVKNKISGNINVNDIRNKTIIATHHPVINMQSTWDDDLSIDNKQQFWQKIKASKTQMIIWGHTHECKDFTQDKILLYSCPSSAYQFNNENRIGFNVYSLTQKITKKTIWVNSV